MLHVRQVVTLQLLSKTEGKRAFEVGENFAHQFVHKFTQRFHPHSAHRLLSRTT